MTGTESGLSPMSMNWWRGDGENASWSKVNSIMTNITDNGASESPYCGASLTRD